MRLLLVWLINAVALMAVAYLLPGITVANFVTALIAALVLGLVNAVIRPILILLTLPATLLTLGLFIFVINGLLFWFVGTFIEGLRRVGVLARRVRGHRLQHRLLGAVGAAAAFQPQPMTGRTYSFEFFPPRTPAGKDKLRATWQQLGLLKPKFFSVTFGAGGSTQAGTLDTVLEIRRDGFEAAPHVSCVASTRARSRAILEQYKSNGIRHIVALRGDLPSGVAMAGELRYASELVAFIREKTGDWFNIEVACYPEYHPQTRYAADEVKNFKKKVDAGANAAITQYFYNADAYFRFVDECRAAGIAHPDRSRHHADRQFLAARALLGHLRRRDPALDAPEVRGLSRRQRLDPRLRPGCRQRAVREAARRGRAGPALLHAEPGRAHHRNLAAARPVRARLADR